jgi:hypothetical protein
MDLDPNFWREHCYNPITPEDAEAEAACAADRRERAAALGFVRVKEKL